MEALTNSTPLEHQLHLKSGKTLRTIGEAAMFIRQLPKKLDGEFHWTTARASLEAADRNPDDVYLLKTATQFLENALRTDSLLKD